MGEQPSLTGLGESAEPKRFIPVSEAFLLPALEEFLNRDAMASGQDLSLIHISEPTRPY